MIQNPLEQSIQKSTKITPPNFCLLRAKSGKNISITLTATPIRNKEGKIIGSVMLFQNVTDYQSRETPQHLAAQHLLDTLTLKIQQSLSLEEILNTTVTEIHQLFQNNRVIIYRFNIDGSGSVVEESLTNGCKPMLGLEEYKPWIADPNTIKHYQLGQIQVIEDLYTRGVKPEYLQFLQFFDIRSKVVIPLFNKEKLWGLLICYNCAVSWQWQQWQIEILKKLATQISIAIQQAGIYDELKLANHKLQEVTGIDTLTQLRNQYYFEQSLAREWKQLADQQIPLSIILCDIDCFKAFNDTYGHEAGNDCLRKVSGEISRSIMRNTDLVARYAGEEFIIMLPHTNGEGAIWIAQKIRSSIKRLKIAHASSPVNRYLTLSFGVATMIPNLQSSPRILVASADQALYQAKSEGRDRVVLWDTSTYHVK